MEAFASQETMYTEMIDVVHNELNDLANKIEFSSNTKETKEKSIDLKKRLSK
jgi:hypothetical protein